MSIFREWAKKQIESPVLTPPSRSADTTKKQGLATKQLSMSRFTLVVLLTILFKILKNVSLLNLLKQKNEVTAFWGASSKTWPILKESPIVMLLCGVAILLEIVRWEISFLELHRLRF